jgi:hypothetical protein
VRDGRLVEHEHLFPTLGKSLPCVGSGGLAPDDSGLQGSRPGGSNDGREAEAEADPLPAATRSEAAVS